MCAPAKSSSRRPAIPYSAGIRYLRTLNRDKEVCNCNCLDCILTNRSESGLLAKNGIGASVSAFLTVMLTALDVAQTKAKTLSIPKGCPSIIQSPFLICKGRLWLSSVPHASTVQEWPAGVGGTHDTAHKAASRIYCKYRAASR